jgi:hypothetical protein
MPGPVLTSAATMICAHGGQGHPVGFEPRVRAGGAAVLVSGPPAMVSGCTSPPPPTGIGTCVSASFAPAATRVLAAGKPLLLQTSVGTCTPTGTPLTTAAAQVRVRGI